MRKKIKPFRKIKYCKRKNLTTEAGSEYISGKLKEGKPFFTGRIGLSELAVMRMYEFGKKDKYPKVINQIYNWSGFFPNDISLGDRFTRCQTEALNDVDLLATSGQLCENYFINRYTPKDSVYTGNFDIFDVFRDGVNWSKDLKGKKILVVTPFSKTVIKQYAKREKLFCGTEILPEFELSVYRSLLTIGDLEDNRFKDWFEALDYMYDEIMKFDFDVAILGCGAYGFPLGSRIKKAGKSAIHMGGSLQILFGIMGRRWDGSRFGGIDKMNPMLAAYYNDEWTYPEEDRPADADKVEYGPYWK